MARKNSPRVPKLGRHPSGLARVQLNGHIFYLGKYGSVEAHQKYVALLAKWEAGGRKPLREARTVAGPKNLRELFDQYEQQIDAAGRFRKAGKETSARQRLRCNLAEFVEKYGDVPTHKCAARHLLLHRDELERRPTLGRVGINRKVGELREALRWAYERGHISRDVWLDVRELPPLRRATHGGREVRRPKRAPSAAEIQAVAAEVGGIVGAMLVIHFAVGCRPGELCGMRWRDLERGAAVVEGAECWAYTVRPELAKGAHLGKELRYAVPPSAVAILSTLPQTPGGFVFCRPGTNEPWSPIQYRTAIQRAARRCGVEPFGGHEVRHGAVTAAARKFGAVAASSFANHSGTQVTETYIHQDRQDAFRVAAGLDAERARASG